MLATTLLVIEPGASLRAGEADPAGDATANAAAHFAEGERAFIRGDFVQAAAEFEAAYLANPHPISLWNAAFSWERAGERVKAANFYRRFLAEAPSETANRDRATSSLRELQKSVALIEIVAPDASSVRVDERDFGADRQVYVAPGTHLVTARIGDETLSEQVTVDAAQTRTVTLAPKKTPVVEPPKQAIVRPVVPLPAPRGQSPWLFVPFASATAAGLGLMIGFGVDTLVARADYDALTKNEQFLFYDQGKFKQDRTNVTIGITGGLALVTGAIALFAIDWGSGKPLVGLGPGEARVVIPF